jgi:hypothetical protein
MIRLRHTFFFATAALAIACSSSKPTVYANGGDGGVSTASCDKPVALGDSDFCSSCMFSAGAAQSTCKSPRVVDACCVYTAAPSAEVTRGTGLHYFSSTDATVDLGCLSAPATPGASMTVTLKGNVRLFSSGNDSANVKIEIYKQGDNGALGALVGQAFTTVADDTKDPAVVETWSTKCPSDGCKLRSFSYAGVPTETPLIIKTSDASGSASQWSDLYDYNVYIANSAVTGGSATYNPSAVASSDVNTVASAAGGFTIDPTKGVLAGEVHDCSDVRLAGAMVDTDVAHDSNVFYFGENEADPLPDTTRAQEGTSHLGLFGMLNLAAGQPIRISAVGISGGQTVLLGTYTVQTFPGAVTALSFRGRRPFQK